MSIKRALQIVAALALAVSSSACVTSSREAFGEVQAAIEQRTNQQIQWRAVGEPVADVDAWILDQIREPLTSERSVAIALLNNRRLQSIYEELGLARAHVLQASLLPNPIFGGSYQSSTNDGPDPEVELSLVADVMALLTLPLRRKVAKHEFEAVKSEVARQVLSLAAEVTAQFYAVQADEQMLAMLRQVVETTEASAEASRQLHEAGNITDLELANEEAMLARAKLDYVSAELRGRKERERLHILMGLWGDQTAIVIPDRLPEIPEAELNLADVERDAIAANLELDALEHRLEAASRDLGLTRVTAFVPQIELGALFTREGEGNHLLGPEVMAPIPLFNQGQPQVATANAQFRKLSEEYYYKAVEVRAAARAARDHLQLARERALYTQRVELPLAQRIFEQTQLQYNAMQVGVFDLIRAKQNQIEVARHYIDDMRDYWLARAEVSAIQQGHVTEYGMQTTALDSVVGSPLH